MFFAEKTSIVNAGFPSRKPKPNDECGESETNENDEKSRQHNFKHCAYHRALFFARDVAFLAFMSGRVFPILKSGAPVFWQLVAVHGSYGHTVVPVVFSVFFCSYRHYSVSSMQNQSLFCIVRLINRILSFHDVFHVGYSFCATETAQFAHNNAICRRFYGFMRFLK